jgi:hypothetical protein
MLVVSFFYVAVSFKNVTDIEILRIYTKGLSIIIISLVSLIIYTIMEAGYVQEIYSQDYWAVKIPEFKKKERQINANSVIINAEEIDWEQRMKGKKKIKEKINNL